MAKNETYYEMLLREEQSYIRDIAELEAMIDTEKKDLESVRKEIRVYNLAQVVPKSFLDLLR